MASWEMAKQAAQILYDKKAEDINIVKIDSISSLADYFLIATGTSNTHVKALADELEVKLKEEGLMAMGVEGYRSNSWILLDYAEVVVHIFTPEGRDFYDLDRLWRDGTKMELDFLK
ncbi:ribosome silencing factor [Scatolibacter rhodanostii]|uniref:ribosome silencing factor n=1 Tax=Scatolibacter rhodanostii TaxID=2014781 RepID=UPI000C080319|nr:ribosome silencing factor [Scatolibacter rhodanostii]